MDKENIIEAARLMIYFNRAGASWLGRMMHISQDEAIYIQTYLNRCGIVSEFGGDKECQVLVSNFAKAKQLIENEEARKNLP